MLEGEARPRREKWRTTRPVQDLMFLFAYDMPEFLWFASQTKDEKTVAAV